MRASGTKEGGKEGGTGEGEGGGNVMQQLNIIVETRQLVSHRAYRSPSKGYSNLIDFLKLLLRKGWGRGN